MLFFTIDKGEIVLKKMLVFDVETSSIDILHRAYGLKVFKKRFDIEEIQRDWTMLGAAWKWLDDDRVYCISVSPKNPLNDYEIIKRLHEVLDEAEIIIGHNSDSFDLKKFNARALYYGLPPIGKKHTIDTLKIARKNFALTSNKLRYLANFLQLSVQKEESPNWNAILSGDPEALSYMRHYNKIDVVVTEKVYKKLIGWHESHPNLNILNPIKDTAGNPILLCPNCQSPNIQKDGFYFLRNGRYQRHKCSDCGRKFKGGKNT